MEKYPVVPKVLLQMKVCQTFGICHSINQLLAQHIPFEDIDLSCQLYNHIERAEILGCIELSIPDRQPVIPLYELVYSLTL